MLIQTTDDRSKRPVLFIGYSFEGLAIEQVNVVPCYIQQQSIKKSSVVDENADNLAMT